MGPLFILKKLVVRGLRSGNEAMLYIERKRLMSNSVDYTKTLYEI